MRERDPSGSHCTGRAGAGSARCELRGKKHVVLRYIYREERGDTERILQHDFSKTHSCRFRSGKQHTERLFLYMSPRSTSDYSADQSRRRVEDLFTVQFKLLKKNICATRPHDSDFK